MECKGVFLARKEALDRLELKLNNAASLLTRTFMSCESAKMESGEDGERTSEFRVMQWNVLADGLSASSETKNFIKCPPDALQWNNRKLRSLQEILLYDPDIIALEEVDHFNDYYLPSLRALGYEGLFTAKINSPCLKLAGNSGPDGCALFYDRARFTLTSYKDVTLKGFNNSPTNQVALLANLLDNVQGRTLCVAVTHLKAKEEFSDLRNAQGNDLLRSISEVSHDSQATLICGDFNAEPTESICQLMEENQYNIPLINAYRNATGTDPEFTTWKIRPDKEVKHTIDYVWHTDKLSVVGCLKIPSSDNIPECRLPCHEFPSDHLALVFDFRWALDTQCAEKC